MSAECLAAKVAKISEIKEANPKNIMAACFDEAYFNTLSDDQKCRFLECLNSGIGNPGSEMGCYAMRPNDYDEFKTFFQPALEKYHKVNLNEKKHVNDWNLKGVAGLPADGILDVSRFQLGPLSMRIRTARNLKKYPLAGAMNQADRVAMENDMMAVFEKLVAMPEFGGEFVSLTPGNPNKITDERYEELVKAHIMFKDMSADSFLVDAGIASDWPYGRGCYISADKGFIIWLGEEDHLRIMAMKKSTVINDVFERLKAAIDVVEELIPGGCAKSPDFGVVTSCPTNMGTGMRASVLLAIPNLTADGTDARAKEICLPYGLGVRGLGGEHTPIGADGTVDISPKARFCISEAEIACALYKGVQQVWAEERVAKILKIKVDNPKNIMAKCFEMDYYNGLADEAKYRFLACLNSGIGCPGSEMGCYAMSPNDYDEFSGFFKAALSTYHKVDLNTTKHVNNWNLEGVEGLPADGKLDVSTFGLGALSMRIRTARNLKKFPLAGAMTQQDRLDMELAMGPVFDQLAANPAFGGEYVSLSPSHPKKISDERYEELVKAHIMFKDMAADQFLVDAGIAGHWPHGRGCFISEDKGFIIWTGEEDHLRIMAMKKSTVINDVFDRLKSAIDVVEDLIPGGCAKSPEFGVVTSCPTNMGTGMRASVHVQLPKLTSDGTDAKAKEICLPFGLGVRGLGGEHTPIGADGTVDISPKGRFCISEAQIACALYKGVKQVWEAENSA